MTRQLQASRPIPVAGFAAVALLALWSDTLSAHPHVFVGTETTVVYDAGRIAALSHTWTFDELYSAMAVEGLDKDRDGTFSREELAELTKVNMDAIKETAFYTFARLGETPLTFAEPKDAYLEYKGGILSLHFDLPLAEPVLAEALGFNFAVYDETFYIAFDYADASAVKLSEGAPKGCTASLSAAPGEDADSVRLADAFSNALGGIGGGLAKTVTVTCQRT
jgi:ABC-type uncharacterized transport system substrate-binding protein